MYSQLKKNNVESTNQLKESELITIYNPDAKGKRILFVGNSITIHDPEESIGWCGQWGMAASKKENDYVHLLMKKISQKHIDSSYCICHVSKWEAQYKTGHTLFNLYKDARDFDADVIIARFVENCPLDEFDKVKFKEEYSLFIDYMNVRDSAKIILTDGFWEHPGNEVIEEIAGERNFPFVRLNDLGEDDSMKAIGLFEHNGVANHPGDKGMEEIAKRIWKVF